MTEPVTHVVAATYREFLHWCQENEVNPRGRQVRYVNGFHHLRGTRNARVVLLPGWLNRPDWRDIRDALLITEAEVVKP